RRARARWPREVARPSLTAAAPAAQGASGRGRKTALQPNRKTLVGRHAGRTTHALQTADIFTRHRQQAGTEAACPRYRRRDPAKSGLSVRAARRVCDSANAPPAADVKPPRCTWSTRAFHIDIYQT